MRIKNLTVLASVAMYLCSMFLVSCGGGDSNKATTPDLTAGKAIYEGKGNCHTCHKVDGTGIPGTFPPLAASDFIQTDKTKAISQTISGSQDKIVVNGKEYPGKLMYPTGKMTVELSDQEIVDVVNYILNSWGNSYGTVTLEEVQKLK